MTADRSPVAGDAARFALLRGEEAKRMVSSWDAVPRRLSDARAIVVWAEISNVALFRARRFARMLWGAGICKRSGGTDPQALKFVAADQIRSVAGRRKS